MKHQKIIKRISVFILSIIIVSISCLSYFVPVCAVEKTYTSWSDFRDDVTASVFYLCSQIGAVVQDHSFVTYIQNKDEWENYWNEDNVVIDEETNEITFSSDLVAYIKQALKEYQQEQYGYQILPTLKYDQIPVSAFGNAMEYRSMCELVKTYKYIAISPYTGAWFYCGDISSYSDGTAGFYVTKYDTDYTRVKLMNYITWTIECPTIYSYYPRNPIVPLEEVCTTFEELETQINSYTIDSFNCVKISDVDLYLSATNYAGFSVISYSGSDVLVFNSATSLKNYSVDKRGIFTTSGFYEDTGALTVSIDDLNNSIGELTDLLDKFKDLIGEQGSGLTEEQLEALLEKFLDEFFNRLGDQGGSGNDNGTGGIIGGGTSGVDSTWYDSVLAYLDKILKQLKSIKRWTIVDTVIDGVDAIADWLDLIHDVLSDADAGAESAVATLSSALDDSAGLLKKKFPFSIPWDILFLVTILAADPEPPYFEVPFHVDLSLMGCTVDYTFEIDFTQFQWLSDILRALLSMTYAVGLMKMTSGIATIKKEE